jgi:acetylornithine deacetylase/succinyl-diaminopimelate desuccinylase-like protein
MSDCVGSLGLDVTPKGFGAVCDLAWYAERGIPGLILGPGRLEHCHIADEHINADELMQATKAYALFLPQSCG